MEASSRLAFLQRIASGDQNVEEGQPSTLDKLNRLAGPSVAAGFEEVEKPDVGVGTALGVGIKEGLMMPLTIFGHEAQELDLDETSEKIASVAGNMIGLGIGFIPFFAGGKIALRGIGIAARVSPEVNAFLASTVGGTVQGAGTAETLEDVPESAALGLVLGVAVDGFFLSRAIKARGLEIRPPGPNTGSPLPDELVSRDLLSKEIELAPIEAKSPERIVTEVSGLRNDALNFDKVLADLGESQLETIRIPDVGDPTELMAYAQTRLPQAQVLKRRVIGNQVHEVLIHNPVDESARLTPTQITQYETHGVFDGMQVLYRGNVHYATGVPVAEGRIQIKAHGSPATFAPKLSDVTIPLSPKVWNKSVARIGQMRNAISSMNEIGFTVATQGAKGQAAIKRGSVDTTGFEKVKSIREYFESNRDAITQLKAPSVEEAIRQHALSRGVKGLIETEHGITKQVHVFDQQTIGFVREPPRVGVTLDQGNMTFLPDGQIQVHSFVPSWNNAIVGPLRKQGFKEKEIQGFLEQMTSSEARRLEDVMDSEFQAIARANRYQFMDGCA